tara:strand:- start:653 stop:895 length:243 start_codon:yes stop_codon:yes gene_type:complete
MLGRKERKAEYTEDKGRMILGNLVFKTKAPPLTIDFAPVIKPMLINLNRNKPATIWVSVFIPSRLKMLPPLPRMTTTRSQ